MHAANVTFKPMGAFIGAEGQGLDLRDPLDHVTVDQIYQGLLDHQVIHFRDQDIDAGRFEEFATTFGDLHPVSLGFSTLHPDTPGINILDANATAQQGGKDDAWHTDEIWQAKPPKIGILRAVQPSSVGGDTAFASMAAAYDALSPAMQAFLEPLTAEASAESVYRSAEHRLRTMASDDPRRPDFEHVAKAANAFLPVSHRLVKVHPDSGRKHLFLSSNGTTRINELSAGESEAVLSYLHRHIVSMAFQARVGWEAGSIAMWDERCTLHTVIADYTERRIMWRAYIADP